MKVTYDTIVQAGLAIIFDNKILLIHPTNASWFGTYSIPKGEINAGENLLDAAIRETYEEIGIKFNKEDFNTMAQFIEYRDKKGKLYKVVWYYSLFLSEPLDMSKIKLQSKEVDWVGFLDKEEAKKRIFTRFTEILEYLN